jgi:hypothetical protein
VLLINQEAAQPATSSTSSAFMLHHATTLLPCSSDSKGVPWCTSELQSINAITINTIKQLQVDCEQVSHIMSTQFPLIMQIEIISYLLEDS